MGSGESVDRSEALDVLDPHASDDIRTQLDRILAHPEFQATENMRSLLRFVVEETLAGRADRLKGYTIATRAFGRADDFDSARDPIVRVQAGRLRQAMERYYLVAGGHDPVRIEIPKGHYVPHFYAQGSRGASHSPGAGALSTVGPSVAVLPFQDLTDGSGSTTFTAGLAEELITELSRFHDITVVSCQHAPRGGDLPLDALELGKATGARFVLEGTVRRDTEVVKVSMHLTDLQTVRQAWSKAFTVPLEASRLIATQEEISRSVADSIANEYGIIARRLSAESRRKSPAELSTYEAMLRYYSYQAAPTLDASEACYAALQLASEREPDYGPVWSALAGFHCEVYAYDAPGFGRPLETAMAYARRGVALDPECQLCRTILALALSLAGDVEGFLRETETALALNPGSATAMGAAGYCYVSIGEFERGRSLMDRALRANPYHPSWYHLVYVFDHIHRREYEHALRVIERRKPEASFWRPVLVIALLGKLGRADEAKAHIMELDQMKSDFPPRARELFGRALKVDAIVDDLLDGLRRAGLPVSA